jgi:hypothetical protein
MRRGQFLTEKDPVHQALEQIVKKVLKGMGVKTRVPKRMGADGDEIDESHELPVIYITAYSEQFPTLASVTSYIAPFLDADKSAPESQRRVLRGHVSGKGFEMLGNSYGAIRLIVDGKAESIILKDDTKT